MTRNLYVGVDLTRLFKAQSLDDVRAVAGDMLGEVRQHPYAARMAAIAAEIEATEPDAVGVQEAALIRTQQPSDFDEASEPNATDVEVDLLELLVSKLADRGLAYEVAAETVTTDVEVPADVDGEQVDVRLTDRTAILTRESVEIDGTRTGTFEAALSLQIEAADVSIERGYCLADVTAADTEVTVATAHLEAVAPDYREDQALELRSLLPSDQPVVLAGDLNSGPGGTAGAYDLLLESFDDAHAMLQSDDGFTCCQNVDLRNEQSRLSRRIDAVLLQGGLEPTSVTRVGVDPSDRVTAEIDGETAEVWPSDHAGVVATVEANPAAATPAGTPTPAQTGQSTTEQANSSTDRESGQGDPEISVPGFGPVAALAALVLAFLANWGRE